MFYPSHAWIQSKKKLRGGFFERVKCQTTLFWLGTVTIFP